MRDLIVEVKQNLADCLFYFAGQSGLPKDDVLAVIEYLRQNAEVKGDGKLSSTTIAVLFSLLYSIKSPIAVSPEEDEGELYSGIITVSNMAKLCRAHFNILRDGFDSQLSRSHWIHI